MSTTCIRPFLALAASVLSLAGSLPVVNASEMLVADRATQRVLAYDPITGALKRQLVTTGLADPTAMTIGFDGDLFVSNQNGTVQRYDIASGAFKGTFASSLPLPAGLAYDAASNTMFVSTAGQFNSNAVYRFNAAGEVVGGTPPNADGPIVLGPETGRAGVASGPDGNLYVGTFADNFGFFFGGDDSATVMRYNADDDFHTFDTITDGTAAGDHDFDTTPNLSVANTLVFDGDGNLYATSLFGQHVVKFELTNGVITDAGYFGPQFIYPSGLAFSPDGQELWISEQGNDNPDDLIYGANQSPGRIFRYSLATGLPIGDPIYNGNGEDGPFLPVAMLLSPVPEPGSVTLAVASLGAFALWNSGRRTASKRSRIR